MSYVRFVPERCVLTLTIYCTAIVMQARPPAVRLCSVPAAPSFGCASFLISRRLKVEREDTVQTGHIIYGTNRLRNEESQKKKKRTRMVGTSGHAWSRHQFKQLLLNDHHWLVPPRWRAPGTPLLPLPWNCKYSLPIHCTAMGF